MKKYLMGLFAVIFAVGFSAYTTSDVNLDKQQLCKYFIYNLTTDLSNQETTFSNYTLSDVVPPVSEHPCPLSQIVCWFRVCDFNNDGEIDQLDFDFAVKGATNPSRLDSDLDGIINDNQAEVTGIYQEKTRVNP